MEVRWQEQAAPGGTSPLLPTQPPLPVAPARGRGAHLLDEDGGDWLDFYAGHAVASLGYGHPRLLSALQRQAGELLFQSNLVPMAVRERAARRLLEFCGPGLAQVFFVNSGAEANENALRLAFRVTGRWRVVALEGAFHGRTAAAAAVTWGAETWYGFPERPFAITFVPPDDLTALTAAMGEDVAAMILEPVQGVAGARELSREFVAAARELTRGWGALLIADEVQCGMGRVGAPLACHALGVVPDLVTLAKGLGGGFPVAAVLASGEVAAAVRYGDLGTTFGGGPLAGAAVEAVIDAIQEDGLLERVVRLGARLQSECLVGPVRRVSGRGLLLGLHTSRPAAEVLRELRQRRILAGGSADPQVVRLLPPLVVEDDDVDRLLAALEDLAP